MSTDDPFGAILGQETAIAALKAAIARDSVPQTLLFVGPESVGKTATALALARTLIPGATNARRIEENQHPDVARVAPDGDFTRVWQLWSRPGHPAGALETLPFAPVAGPCRFYLFERAETLNDESANSLLKALEEPPPYARFVLCAPSASSVLPTILSRCQRIRFGPVPTGTIVRGLMKRHAFPETEARTLAAYAEGAPGRAFRYAEQPELRTQREALLDLAERISHSPGIAAFRLAEELRMAAKPGKAKRGDADAEGDAEKSTRGELSRALDVLAAWHGDLLAAAVRGPETPLVHPNRREQVLAAAARYRPEQLQTNLETLFTFRRHLARNANAQLATEVLLLKLVPKK